MTVLLENDVLTFTFPEVHQNASCNISFQKTLRIPDDNREYPLPPGLGKFPLRHIEDFSESLPRAWTERGGVILPMFQAEAMWIHFSSEQSSFTNQPYPFAVKIAAGKINAITGETWRNDLSVDLQDYLVIPDQPWLDGFCVQKGLIRQFVAMPLGLGYTAEEQLNNSSANGGIQIIVYPMKRSFYEKLEKTEVISELCCKLAVSDEMGLAPGGLMRQEIYEDEYGLDAWDLTQPQRCFVNLVNSTSWKLVSGESMPCKSPSAKDYADAGLPWFDYYDDSKKIIGGTGKLSSLDSVAALGVKKGQTPLPENDAIIVQKVTTINAKDKVVKQGKW